MSSHSSKSKNGTIPVVCTTCLNSFLTTLAGSRRKRKTCYACYKTKEKEWRQKNQKHIKKYTKEYKQEHANAIAIKTKERRNRNRKAILLRQVWKNMLARCYIETSVGYPLYGARGIKVCERWRTSFDTFKKDMGYPTITGYQLDRINNDGDYTPENCRWTDRKTQARNRRNSRILEYQGEKRLLEEWAEIVGINSSAIRRRIDGLKWTIEKSLTTPIKK